MKKEAWLGQFFLLRPIVFSSLLLLFPLQERKLCKKQFPLSFSAPHVKKELGLEGGDGWPSPPPSLPCFASGCPEMDYSGTCAETPAGVVVEEGKDVSVLPEVSPR